ncbi:MAG: aminotransferase class III-fold pyridoxal phosphate-dependent enzyme [Spirochaetales bacterium]|nr:aminotransferase class III-fold pyridoxal phosphate-dependent enzyme [Spirochaetales bacterium]
MSELLHAIPPIKRARAYYLYDFKGGRYLDLYQQNGRALLGHRPPGLTRVLKQVVSKGLITDLPCLYEKRLEKLLQKLLPQYKTFRVATCLHKALELAARYLKKNITSDMIQDPLTHGPADGKPAIAYWRPFCDIPQKTEVIVPLLPLAVSGAPVVVCFRRKPPTDFPPSEIISPLLLAGLVRCGYDLLQYGTGEWYNNELLKHAPGWKQRGIYITAEFKQKLYDKIFLAFLKQGFVLSPFYPGPSILPGELSDGELKKMLKLFHEIPGE